MLKLLILFILVAHYLSQTLSQCSLLIPEQAHVSTELVFFHRALNRVNKFFIDEYLDRENGRSSFKVSDENESEKIYYNEITTDNRNNNNNIELGPSGRRFLQYDVYGQTCYNMDIHEWHLAEIRRLALGVMPADHMYPRNTDIAIGPSGLLFAIESRLEDLRYRGTIFCEQRWSFVDVFELVDIKPLSAFFSVGSEMLVQVEILIKGDDNEAASSPISDKDFGKSLASVAIAAKYKLQIVNIRLCSVSRGKVSKANKDRKPYECKEDEFGYPEQDLLASFDLIENLKSNQLIGRALLDQLGEFDFELSPFVRPVGIGCYHKEHPAGASLSASRPKTFGPADSNQFSAEYLSLRGSEGESYVAYDGNRRVARHDRDGRKSVYDLESGRSFHVDQFPAAAGAPSSSSPDSSKHAGGRSPPTRNCVSFDGEDGDQNPYLVDSGQFSPMARLLGIDEEDQAHFVGSKTIDDETFDVYELELERGKNAPSPGGFNLPIIMEPVNFVMPQLGANDTDDAIRFFLTYYVSELINSEAGAAAVGPDSKKPQLAGLKGVKIPRFVELWQFSETRKLRSLVNLVEFTQFSWSLTVQAEDESSAGAGGPSGSSRLFNIASCAQERSEQLELSFNTIYSWVPVELIRANRHSIREALHEQLASALDIPRPNILDVEFYFSPPHTGLWLVNARIAELTSGLSNDQLIGYLEWSKSQNWLTKTMLAEHENRHSLSACKLDSLALGGGGGGGGQQSNTIVFCPGKTLCLLVEPQAIEQHRADLMVVERDIERAIRSNDDRLAMCEVHQFGWRPAPTSLERAVIPRVIENQSRLLYNNFIFKLADPSGRLLPVDYRGFGHGVKVKLLDSIGLAASQGGLKSPLAGLRYLAAGESHAGQPSVDANGNYAYKLLTSGTTQEPGAQCRMACQMDEFCESYSLCRRPVSSSSSAAANRGKNTDCILSTMRLTRPRIGELARILRQPNLAEEALKIDVSTADDSSSGGRGLTEVGDEHSEIYHFKRDPECGLHPRDILAQFKVSKSLNLIRNPESSGLDKSPPAGVHLSVSLDECAGISNEAASMQNSPEAEFVYCPMESLCLTSSNLEAAAAAVAKVPSASSEQPPAANQTCFTYTKTHRQFYEYKLFSKMSLKLADEQEAAKLDALAEIDLLKKLKVGQVIEGLGVEQCARDCNLDQSKCLAFDVCEFETDVTVCTLYFIRSPIASQTSAGLLTQEERFYSHASNSRDLATLVENRHCAHFYLKDAYFQLKINHLQSGGGGGDSQSRTKLNEVEAKILAHDTKMGEAMKLMSIIGAASGGGGGSGEKASINQRSGGGGGGDGALKHLALIVLAAIVGALAYLNGGQVCTLASDKIQALRASRGRRFGDHRISQLHLPAHLDL